MKTCALCFSTLAMLSNLGPLYALPALDNEYLTGRSWMGNAEWLSFQKDNRFTVEGPYGSLGIEGKYKIESGNAVLTIPDTTSEIAPFWAHRTIVCKPLEDLKHPYFSIFLHCNPGNTRFGADDSKPEPGALRYWGKIKILVQGSYLSDSEVTFKRATLFHRDPTFNSPVVFGIKPTIHKQASTGHTQFQTVEKRNKNGIADFWHYLCIQKGEEMAGNTEYNCGWVFGDDFLIK